MPLTEKNPLSSNAIKLIAIAAMTVDHIAWAVFPGYPKEFLPLLMHIIGRITCPIMCYCIAEGYHYTRNIRKYTARLFVFALISHFCYIYFSHDFIDWHSFIPFYYGGVLNGAGYGLIYTTGTTGGGTDIVARCCAGAIRTSTSARCCSA